VTGPGLVRTVIVVSNEPLEPPVIDAIEACFTSLQGHASAEQMRADIVTDDFETGFVGGHMWTGRDGLRDFIAARSMFFDEHELLQILQVGPADGGRVRARTRLRFFLRRVDQGAARSEEYTGDVPHLVVPAGGIRAMAGRRATRRRGSSSVATMTATASGATHE
jgi:hypothetical protein